MQFFSSQNDTLDIGISQSIIYFMNMNGNTSNIPDTEATDPYKYIHKHFKISLAGNQNLQIKLWIPLKDPFSILNNHKNLPQTTSVKDADNSVA